MWGIPLPQTALTAAPFEAITRAEYIAAVKTPWSGHVMMPRFLAGLGIVAQEQHQAFTLMVDDNTAAVIDCDQVWITLMALVAVSLGLKL